MFSGEFSEVSKNIFSTEPLRTTTSDRRRRANSSPQPKILEVTKMIIIAKQNIKKLIPYLYNYNYIFILETWCKQYTKNTDSFSVERPS